MGAAKPSIRSCCLGSDRTIRRSGLAGTGRRIAPDPGATLVARLV
jgi:hypothetical protein